MLLARVVVVSLRKARYADGVWSKSASLGISLSNVLAVRLGG